MDDSEIIERLDKLTLEADMLTRVLDDALKQHEHKDGISGISFLSGIIREKFKSIRDVF